MTEGVDYSFGRPGGAALVAAGKRFAMRYVPYSGDGGKGLGRAELADLLGHHIAVGLVLERGKASALLGRKAGIADANTADDAVRSLGFPKDQPVYFAVDFDATKSQQAAIDAYLGGAASVIGVSRVGVYGSIDVVERCAANGSARWFWQTYAWSGGALSHKAHVYQYHNGQTINGAAVDLCRSLAADFGAFSNGPKVAPVPAIVPRVVTSAPRPTERNAMIAQGGLTVTSSHIKRLAAGQPLFRSPGGPRVTATAAAGPVAYIGTAGSGWHAVQVSTKGPYRDGVTRPTVLYVPAAAGPVEAR